MSKLTMRRLSTRLCSIWQKVKDSFYISAAKLVATPTVANRISITNGCEYADGAGAQVQRVLSIIALAKHFKFSFTLNPINKVEIQPLDHINSELMLQQEIAILNAWICKRFGVHTKKDLDGYRIIRNPRELFTIVLSIFLSGIFPNRSRAEKLIFTDAYFLTMRKPNVWKLIVLRSNLDDDIQGAQKVLVAHIHLRLSTFSASGDRFVPIDYYKEIMDKLISDAHKGANEMKIVIHTDFNSPIIDSQFFLRHATPESLKYWVNLGLLKSNFEVDLETVSAAREELIQLLRAYGEAHLFNEKTWTAEWESMASADWLVINKSSFSLIGALLNESGVIFVPKSWIPTPPHWIQQGK